MKTLDELIAEAIIERLTIFKGNRTKTAKSLQVTTNTLRRHVNRPKFEQGVDDLADIGEFETPTNKQRIRYLNYVLNGRHT